MTFRVGYVYFTEVGAIHYLAHFTAKVKRDAVSVYDGRPMVPLPLTYVRKGRHLFSVRSSLYLQHFNYVFDVQLFVQWDPQPFSVVESFRLVVNILQML